MTHVATDLPVGKSGRVDTSGRHRQVATAYWKWASRRASSCAALGAAPLGDPLEFELRGYRLSLRKSEAQHIELDHSNPN